MNYIMPEEQVNRICELFNKDSSKLYNWEISDLIDSLISSAETNVILLVPTK